MTDRLSRAAVYALTIAALGASPRAQQPDAAAVTSALRQDMQALAAHDVPFGIVLGRDETLDMLVWRAPRAAVVELSSKVVVANFRQDWRRQLRISNEDRPLSAVSVRAAVCVSALERTVAARTVSGTPVEVLFAVMRELDPTLEALPPPGVVGGGGTPSASSLAFTSAKVAVPAGPLRRALDAIVSSTHNLGWIAIERCSGAQSCRCDPAFVTATDVVYTFYDAAAGIR
jgi:hypothetical protein